MEMASSPSYVSLKRATGRVAQSLVRDHEKLVLAESCTGGLLASLFTETPGASDYFCGSHVVYREGSKQKWLGVSPALLKRHSAVSPEVVEAMARGALRKTPEATLAGAITGYLGPTGKHVGLVYITALRRGSRKPITRKLNLRNVPGAPEKARLQRRAIAAEETLAALLVLLHSS